MSDVEVRRRRLSGSESNSSNNNTSSSSSDDDDDDVDGVASSNSGRQASIVPTTTEYSRTAPVRMGVAAESASEMFLSARSSGEMTQNRQHEQASGRNILSSRSSSSDIIQQHIQEQGSEVILRGRGERDIIQQHHHKEVRELTLSGSDMIQQHMHEHSSEPAASRVLLLQHPQQQQQTVATATSTTVTVCSSRASTAATTSTGDEYDQQATTGGDSGRERDVEDQQFGSEHPMQGGGGGGEEEEEEPHLPQQHYSSPRSILSTQQYTVAGIIQRRPASCDNPLAVSSDHSPSHVRSDHSSSHLTSDHSPSQVSSHLHHHRPATLLHEEPLEIQCGEKSALLFVSKLCQGSKGPCILYGQEWLTPNELQYICGRETAKDWKRSIRHKGKSLKSLIAQGFLKVHPPICDCPGCRVSSPVNRSRLADKCGFTKLPSYLNDKSMAAEGFPTMWRRNSTSSDETDQHLLHATADQQQTVVLHGGERISDQAQPKRAHSDEPRYYQPAQQIHVTKRPRSSSPDLDRGRLYLAKRRCMSETCAVDVPGKTGDEPGGVLLRRLPGTAEDFTKQEQKLSEQELKREQLRMAAAGTLRGTLVKDLPVLTIPSTGYPGIYAHNHLGLHHRHVTSPRLLSPSFIRPSSAAVVGSPQLRVLHDQAPQLSPHNIYAQQLRHDYPTVGMATMFPYSFNHPLPGNQQLLSPHFQKHEPERHEEESGVKPAKEEKTEPAEASSPAASSESSPQGVLDKADMDEGVQEGEARMQVYPELAQIAAQWDIEEVCKFVTSVTGCSEYSDVFREQEIDGEALILLTEEHLSSKMGIKLGPALKIKAKIDELRCVYSDK